MEIGWTVACEDKVGEKTSIVRKPDRVTQLIYWKALQRPRIDNNKL